MKAQLALIDHHTKQIGLAWNTKHKALSLYHNSINEVGLSPRSRKRLGLTETKLEEPEIEKMFK